MIHTDIACDASSMGLAEAFQDERFDRNASEKPQFDKGPTSLDCVAVFRDRSWNP